MKNLENINFLGALSEEAAKEVHLVYFYSFCGAFVLHVPT
jgi:hypothetical protein